MTTPATTPADGELDIDALERLARAATPGPWHCHKKDEEAGEFLMDFGGIFNADGTPNYESRNAMSGWISLRDRDAPYIAAANPETVLSLIGRIRELESALATPSPGKAPEPYLAGFEDGLHTAAFYVEDHCEDGEHHARIIERIKRPDASPGKAEAERWQPIETAPKWKEVLVWREDSGPFIAKLIAPEDVPEAEADSWEDPSRPEWLSDAYGWQEGSERPTHWMPLPPAPQERDKQ